VSDIHLGFLGTIHMGDKARCPLCDLPEGTLVTEQELMDLRTTKKMEIAQRIHEGLVIVFGIDDSQRTKEN